MVWVDSEFKNGDHLPSLPELKRMKLVVFVERFHPAKRETWQTTTTSANKSLLSSRGRKIEASAGFMGEGMTSVAPGLHVCGLGCSACVIGWSFRRSDKNYSLVRGYMPFTNVQ